jgi:hypothetical protein
MRPGVLIVFLMIAASVACGGSSPTTPSAPSNPPTSVRGTWVDAPPTTIGTVESNPNGPNLVPFGGIATAASGPPFPGTTYQQVYLGSLFGSNQVRLTDVEFFTHLQNGTRQVVSANYTFSMSTTARAVDALDSVNLASNVGTNQQVVFSGALGQGAIVDSRFRLTFSNPFSFTPASGNLLLHVVRSNPGPNTSASFLIHTPNDGFPSGLSSRASDFSNVQAGVYLVTRFHHQRCQCPTEAPCSC